MQPNQRKLIIALLKAKGIEILDKSDYEVPEYMLAQKMNESELLKTLSVDKAHNEKPVVVWDSKIGQSIACYVSADGFDFSGIGCFYRTDKQMIIPVSARHYKGTEKGDIIAAEVKEIKEFIAGYDESLEKLFY